MPSPANAPGPAATLVRYKGLVERYHTTLDLVSDRALEEFDRYLEEGRRYAALIRRLAGEAPVVVDVGSGVGLPGVVVATELQQAKVHLVERRRKRTAFLELVVGSLRLSNTSVFGGDIRELKGVAADVVTAQAVAPFVELAELTASVRGETCWIISRRARERYPITLAREQADARSVAETLPAGAEVVEEALDSHGSLVAIRLPGGSTCRSSA